MCASIVSQLILSSADKANATAGMHREKEPKELDEWRTKL